MKRFFKYVIYTMMFVIVFPWALLEMALRAIFGRDVLFASHAELLCLFPGKLGSFLRNTYYFLTLQECPLHCQFLIGTMFTHSEAEVGQRVFMGANCIVGMVKIGDDTMFADNVYVLSGGHQHGTLDRSIRFQDQPTAFTKLSIGKNSWIGTNTVIMANVGDDCILGAGSVVTRDIPSGSVAVGNPARVIRETFPTSKAEPATTIGQAEDQPQTS